ncbi:hypothetical protein [Halopseudomonas aestusnigri]|uniref:hypothetical protein n=1 Tax=Halopseudomonas aestusnigri TaxID=857252 RepID=UPI0030038FAE
MKVNSWDLWDTLISRRTLSPKEVFYIIEKKVKLPGFAKDRIDAELASRVGVEETTLERIYDHLDYPEDVKSKLKELELKIEEELTYPIIQTVNKVRPNDIIISDMYLPRDFVVEILRKLNIPIQEKNIFISSETLLTKRSCKLYEKAMETRDILQHTGDNVVSDIKMAQKAGISAKEFTASKRLTPVEKHWTKRGELGIALAGVLRAARLSCPLSADPCRWEIYSQTVAPLLISFCENLIKQSLNRGIRKLYFLSRDGQILYKICKSLIDQQYIDIEAVYLYASRQALHTPGFSHIETAKSWILDKPHPLSIRTVANRTSTPAKEILNILTTKNFAGIGIDDSLPLDTLEKIIASPDFIQLIRKSSSSLLPSCKSYFESVGLLDDWKSGTKIGYVDIGWRCRIQASLDSICRKLGCDPDNSFGFYFGVHNSAYKNGSRAFGYLQDQFNTHCLYKDFQHFDLLEFFMRATHGPVLSYKSMDGIVEIGPTPTGYIDEIALDHQAILSTLEHYISHRKLITKLCFSHENASIHPFRRLANNPKRQEVDALSYGTHSSEQHSGHEELFVCKIRICDLFKKNVPGYWPEGSAKLSKLYLMYFFRKLIARFVKWIRKTL